jgi:cytochrome c oxidase assembly protein subunit 11
MIGLDIASVPLYRLFCQVTGYNGTTQNAARAPDRQIAGRSITVRFDAQTGNDLGWEFRPLVNSVTVHPGEERTIAYRAVNKTNAPVTGTATHNVTPDKAGIYFDKIQCFCFTKQHLDPGQSVDLTVSFFIDPDIVNDPNTRDLDTITLSYTMFRAKNDDQPVAGTPASTTTPSSAITPVAATKPIDAASIQR